jgi:hypothetical protein
VHLGLPRELFDLFLVLVVLPPALSALCGKVDPDAEQGKYQDDEGAFNGKGVLILYVLNLEVDLKLGDVGNCTASNNPIIHVLEL